MSSYKTNIPIYTMIAAFNQVHHYLQSYNYFKDLPEISTDEFSAASLFGGEGDWTPEDTVHLDKRLTPLADNLSIQIFRVTHQSVSQLSGVVVVENPSEVTGSEFGFNDLFAARAPGLLG